MAVINRSDLQYRYKWTADKGDNPLYIGKKDRDLVDRDEGYEVLNFLNSVCDTKEQALHAERLIKTLLPGKTQNRNEIHQWLIDNWQN
ncbi:hypothetical protein [Pseudomonas sp. ESBL1]|uniref:hypothetical protein n=1 Tax=Pseudomonas sp. ESBL1 TaxID=3077324 RepID=UPI002FCC891A